jgi:hypothetical protein
LVVAGVNGFIWSYEAKSYEGAPYALLSAKIGMDEKSSIATAPNENITSICLSEPED